jgi:phosphoglycerol transferase MdoB-like AlkP superfamily enzyme
MFAAFVIRLVLYALLLGLTSRAAQTLWSNHGLDGVAALQPWHDAGVTALLVAPVVLALLGVGPLRRPALFVAFFLAGAALSAPFAFSHLVGS